MSSGGGVSETCWAQDTVAEEGCGHAQRQCPGEEALLVNYACKAEKFKFVSTAEWWDDEEGQGWVGRVERDDDEDSSEVPGIRHAPHNRETVLWQQVSHHLSQKLMINKKYFRIFMVQRGCVVECSCFNVPQTGEYETKIRNQMR